MTACKPASALLARLVGRGTAARDEAARSPGGASGTTPVRVRTRDRVRSTTARVAAALAFAAMTGASFVPAAPAAAPSLSVASASTPMTSTTTFTAASATATCPSGTTLVGGGDQLTRAGEPVPNDGAVTLGVYPSSSSGTTLAAGATTPESWTATGGYSGMAPGLDTVSSYALCASGLTSATEVEVATSAAGSLGPVTANCPAGTSLIGGGGGFTSFITGTNAKILDSYPSDAAGDLPTNGAAGLTAWTVQGNSNSPAGETTTATALCASDVTVPTEVATATNDDDNAQGSGAVTGGTPLPATATCPAGTTLLGGGSDITSAQNGSPGGPGNGGQGVHVIGDFPGTAASGTSTSPVSSGPAGSAWTIIAENGGQNLDDLNVEALALCATIAPGSPGLQLSTQLSTTGPVSLGSSVTDQATLTGATATAGGTISYGVYSNSSCTTLVASLTPAGNGVTNGAAPASTAWAPSSAGTFYFQASYSGDANNPGPVVSPCANESITVNKAAPTLTANATASASLGATLSEQATLSGGDNPTGTLSFKVYGPNDPTCSGTPVFAASASASSGAASPETFTPSAGGTYLWEVGYSGDANNNAASTSCGDPNETSVVSSSAASGAKAASGSRASGSGATTAGSSAKATATPGKAGSLTLSTGTTDVIVSWPATGIAPGKVTITLSRATTAKSSDGFAAGTSAVVVSVTNGDGVAVTRLSSPLDIEFPNLPATAIPAFSEKGTTWTGIPRLASAPTLPAGWPDGSYRDSVGTLHILTRHTTYFAALKKGSRYTPALMLKIHVAPTLDLERSHTLVVVVEPTTAAAVTLSLTRHGRALASRKANLGPARSHTVVLVVPKATRTPGAYSLELSARAGGQQLSQTVGVRFTR